MQMRVVSSFSSGLEVMLTRLVDENRSSFKYEARMMFVIASSFTVLFRLVFSSLKLENQKQLLTGPAVSQVITVRQKDSDLERVS